MKKILVSVLALVFAGVFSAQLFADGPSGCGLGTKWFKGKTGVMAHFSAASTNGSSGNQTFGITSGTSGCDSSKAVASNDKVENFVASNMESLATDIAKGEGEYLDTLASLMEVEDATAFSSKLQKNFSKIYSSDSITSTEVVANIQMVVQG